MKQYEIIFTETVRSKVVIDANSLDEAEEMWANGEYHLDNVREIESYDVEIEEIEEIGEDENE